MTVATRWLRGCVQMFGLYYIYMWHKLYTYSPSLPLWMYLRKMRAQKAQISWPDTQKPKWLKTPKVGSSEDDIDTLWNFIWWDAWVQHANGQDVESSIGGTVETPRDSESQSLAAWQLLRRQACSPTTIPAPHALQLLKQSPSHNSPLPPRHPIVHVHSCPLLTPSI